MRASLPAGRWMHTGHAWSGERLRGQRVAVIGAGASAMDAAAEALEHGAAQVTLLVRRPDLPRSFYGRHFARQVWLGGLLLWATILPPRP